MVEPTLSHGGGKGLIAPPTPTSQVLIENLKRTKYNSFEWDVDWSIITIEIQLEIPRLCSAIHLDLVIELYILERD